MPGADGARELIAALPCAVDLPPEWGDYFEKTGQVMAHWEDHRRFPRFYFRVPAALDCTTGFPALKREQANWKVYLKDISRGGIAFMHGEQLYPGEQIVLTLLDGATHKLEVLRCRRVFRRCFEIGGNFINQKESA